MKPTIIDIKFCIGKCVGGANPSPPTDNKSRSIRILSADIDIDNPLSFIHLHWRYVDCKHFVAYRLLYLFDCIWMDEFAFVVRQEKKKKKDCHWSWGEICCLFIYHHIYDCCVCMSNMCTYKCKTQMKSIHNWWVNMWCIFLSLSLSLSFLRISLLNRMTPVFP